MTSSAAATTSTANGDGSGLPPHLTVITPDLNLTQHLLSGSNNLYLSEAAAAVQERPSRSHGDGLVPKCEPVAVVSKHDGNLILPNVEHQFLLQFPMSCPSPISGPSDPGDQLHTSELVQLMPGVFSSALGGSTGGQMQLIRPGSATGLPLAAARKRKSSQSSIGQPPPTVIKPEPELSSSITRMGIKQGIPDDIDMANASLDSTTGSPDSSDGCPMQSIRFSPFQQNQWHVLCNNNLQNL